MIFGAFAVAVEVYVGWGKLLTPWRELAPGTSAMMLVLTGATYGLRTLRLFDYFYADMRGRFGLCLKLMLQHNLWNNLLPMRSGELSFPLLMHRYFQVPVARSVPALVWLRVLDLHSLLALGLAAFGSLWFGWEGSLLVFALWLPIPWLVFKSKGYLVRKLEQYAADRGGRWSALALTLLDSLPKRPRELLRSWAWTVLNWILKMGVFAWVLKQFIETGYLAAVAGAIGGDLTGVIPIQGVAGTGTYEAGVVAALVPFGVPSVAALQAAVNLHLYMLGSSLIGGAVSLLIGEGRKPVSGLPHNGT